MSLLNCSEHC